MVAPEIVPGLPFECCAKTRHRQPDQACRIEKLSADAIKVVFKQPQRAITPGQSVVFYAGEECLGGAVIEQAMEQNTDMETTA